MMRRAGIVHGLRLAAVLLLAVGLSWGGYELRGRIPGWRRRESTCWPKRTRLS
jgi:hypothetical protein